MSDLSYVSVHLLSQQHLKTMVLMEQIEDVRHLIVPADTRQQTHLDTHKYVTHTKKTTT